MSQREGSRTLVVVGYWGPSCHQRRSSARRRKPWLCAELWGPQPRLHPFLGWSRLTVDKPGKAELHLIAPTWTTTSSAQQCIINVWAVYLHSLCVILCLPAITISTGSADTGRPIAGRGKYALVLGAVAASDVTSGSQTWRCPWRWLCMWC